MKEILLLNAVSPLAADVLGKDYTLSADAKDPTAVMLRSFSMHDYDLPQSVLAVARAGAGTNNIPTAEYAKRGIAVFNTPGANANAVKELCLAAVLLASRGIVDGIAWTNTLVGDDVSKQVEKGKKRFVGHEIIGKTLGVVGLGAIGAQVGDNAAKLGMNVLGYDPYITIDSTDSITKIGNLDELFALSDYITLHVPLTDGTRSLINASAIAKMKDGVNIINLSRGELCVNADILTAVKSGKIHTYVTDFAATELLNVPNIIVMPHLGASTEEAEENCAIMAAQNLKDFIENGNIKNSVNFPSCAAPRAGVCRVTVIHGNGKNTLKCITDAMADADIHTENLVSCSRGDYAYTIIDAASDVPLSVLDRIRTSENVIRVRKI